jgi:DNA-binding response OmpR family regulator
VLLDLKLPHIMGLEVLKWIRQQPGPARVVILLSASGEEIDIASAYRLGANAYLIKPSEASKLQDMARAIRDFWLTQNTPPPDARVEEVEYVRSPHPTRVAVGRRDRAERRPVAVNGAVHQPFPISTTWAGQ